MSKMSSTLVRRTRSVALAMLVFLGTMLCCLSCSSLAPIVGASGGAAIGSLAGPGGAALGGALGAAAGEIAYPADAPPPDTVWGLLAKLLDQAVWLAILIGVVYILTLFAPPPKEWFKRRK